MNQAQRYKSSLLEIKLDVREKRNDSKMDAQKIKKQAPMFKKVTAVT